jgi:hypothetical protein
MAGVLRRGGSPGGKSGAVVVVQRTSSDLKLHPHLHILFLEGVYRELDAATVGFTELPRLSTREVGEVLERAVVRIVKHLRRRGLLATVRGETDDEPDLDGLSVLAASAASGQSPPAGRDGCRGGARARRWLRSCRARSRMTSRSARAWTAALRFAP